MGAIWKNEMMAAIAARQEARSLSYRKPRDTIIMAIVTADRTGKFLSWATEPQALGKGEVCVGTFQFGAETGPHGTQERTVAPRDLRPPGGADV
jgi:hypothetical protein